MTQPAILAEDDEPEVLNAVERDLRKHFAADYRILKAGSGSQALRAVHQFKQRNAPVALFVVDARMPQMSDTEFLIQVRQLAGRLVSVVPPAVRGYPRGGLAAVANEPRREGLPVPQPDPVPTGLQRSAQPTPCPGSIAFRAVCPQGHDAGARRRAPPGMSQCLVDRITDTANIEVLAHAEVVAVHGAGRLEAVDVAAGDARKRGSSRRRCSSSSARRRDPSWPPAFARS